MTSDHDRYREWAGAYVLGALDPQERSDFSAHLRGCSACRDEVAELAPLPALLAMVPTSELDELAEGDAASMGQAEGPRAAHASGARVVEEAIAAAARERRASRRRLQRWRVATSLAAAVALLAMVALGVLVATGAARPAGPAQGPADEVVPLEVVRSQATEASVDVAPRRWGTEVYLRLDGLPARDVYVVTATGRDGARQQIGTWGRTPSAAARITAATAIPTEGLESVLVTSADDDDVIVASRR